MGELEEKEVEYEVNSFRYKKWSFSEYTSEIYFSVFLRKLLKWNYLNGYLME